MENSLSAFLFQGEELKYIKQYYRREPYAKPGLACSLINMFNLEVVRQILATHSNCWLVQRGVLAQGSTGRMNFEDFISGFQGGQSLVIRHAEKANVFLSQLSTEFQNLFQAPIDIQLYATPANKEGFDWHYDLEDVFVFQTVGVKEFYLRKNKRPQQVEHRHLPKNFVLEEYCEGPEIRCLLYPGDYLYIPAGYWHKAKAQQNSFHISVGVMNH